VSRLAIRLVDPGLRRLVLLLFGLLLAAGGAGAADRVLDAGRLASESVSLTGYFSVLVDPDRSLTLADVQRPDIAARFVGGQAVVETLNLGYTHSACWLRLQLRNSTDLPVTRMLDIGYPVLSDIQFHQALPDGRWQSLATGVAMPFASRPYPNRYFVFPLTLPAHSEQTLYLRVRTESAMLIPARLWEPAAFDVQERDDYALHGLYLGIAMAMILFNFLLFVALRDGAYLLYICFSICTVLAVAASNGLGKEFLWQNATGWSDIAPSICYVYMQVALLLFMRRMLGTRALVPRLDRVLRVLVGINLLMSVGIVVAPDSIGLPLRLFVAEATALVHLLINAWCAVVKRQRLAMIFLAAFSMLTLGALLLGLKILNLAPVNFLTTNALSIGSALEMILMAFALAYRFNMIRSQAAAYVNQANAGLAQRLLTREAELTQSHQRLREIEHRQTLTEERQRLMQDMHDGLGSSLATALRVVEHGHMDEAEVAEVLKDCIDDLKLAIDSMEPVQADLLLLLATLRYRLGPRLESTGIQLRWDVQDVPMLSWLDPRISLHILRILQEAFANVIKHAQASQIKVSTGVDGGDVLVSITDNGRGFSVEHALAGGGKGLANQLRRAHSIGAQVTWESGEDGSCMTLRLPIEPC
jgi:signal transduction histidine kinase